MHHVGNKRSPGEYLRTMSAINICKMTFKDAKLKQKKSFQYLELFWSHAQIHTGFLEFWNPAEFFDNCFNPLKKLKIDILMFYS